MTEAAEMHNVIITVYHSTEEDFLVVEGYLSSVVASVSSVTNVDLAEAVKLFNFVRLYLASTPT